MRLRFTKMTGAGNDFIMADNRGRQTELRREQIAALCDRHFGVGADGLMLVEAGSGDCQATMRYFNSDGGEAEMCGNGARCFARFASEILRLQDRHLRFLTKAGPVSADLLEGGRVRIGLTPPGQRSTTKIFVGGQDRTVHLCHTGVPHAVLFVDDVETVNVVEWGRTLRYHVHFAPQGTNANFAQVTADGLLSVRTYERGVEDETLACGTGVTACALIASQAAGLSSPICVQVRGGDRLVVGFRTEGEGVADVTLEGPADTVFEGEIDVSALMQRRG